MRARDLRHKFRFYAIRFYDCDNCDWTHEILIHKKGNNKFHVTTGGVLSAKKDPSPGWIIPIDHYDNTLKYMKKNYPEDVEKISYWKAQKMLGKDPIKLYQSVVDRR